MGFSIFSLSLYSTLSSPGREPRREGGLQFFFDDFYVSILFQKTFGEKLVLRLLLFFFDDTTSLVWRRRVHYCYY